MILIIIGVLFIGIFGFLRFVVGNNFAIILIFIMDNAVSQLSIIKRVTSMTAT
ncbi:MAG: hypothetical protein ACFFB6_08920 [Promethearchaeota archaeon]